jgi:NAD(P)-dependent dehydrogenase (short-subunit alcohol dehydrogenase family)
MKLDESVAAVVTGGASGLGRATVKALRETGVRVTIFDLNEAQGTEAAAATGAHFCKVNVTSNADVEGGFKEARARFGQERILVNCAGGGRSAKTVSRDKKTGDIRRHSVDDFDWSVQLNLVGSFRCITHAAAGMMTLSPLEAGERGVIVNTASVAARDGQIGQAAYSAAKAGIVGMTLTIARDLASEGIRVNTIMPGIFATPPMLGAPEAVRVALSESVPFPKRLGVPAEYAAFLLEIARNGYLNGESIRLDGAIRMPPR